MTIALEDVYEAWDIQSTFLNINSLVVGDLAIFKQIDVINSSGISCRITVTLRSLDLSDDKSTLVAGNGLVPLPEPMLTWIYVTIWCH